MNKNTPIQQSYNKHVYIKQDKIMKETKVTMFRKNSEKIKRENNVNCQEHQQMKTSTYREKTHLLITIAIT